MKSKAMKSRVERGAALLDRLYPGWADRISPDDLTMESCHWCILGQVWGEYHAGCNVLEAFSGARFPARSAAFGFTLHGSEQHGDSLMVLWRFQDLADCWREAIRERIKPEAIVGATR